MATFPITEFDNITMRSINPTRVTTVLNGIEQRSAIGAQFYQFTAAFENLSKSDQRKLMAFIDEVKGPLTEFDLALPDYLGDSTGGHTATLTVSSTASANAISVLVTTSATTGATLLKAGDLIQFASHKKLYSVKADVLQPGVGSATITLTQALRSAVASSTTVAHQNISASVRFAGDINEFSVDQTEFASFQLEFNEVLQ